MVRFKLFKSTDGIQTHKLSDLISGIQLNITKTEILNIGYTNFVREQITISYDGKTHVINTKETTVICGIAYGVNNEETYMINVKEKIVKLEKNYQSGNRGFLRKKAEFWL